MSGSESCSPDESSASRPAKRSAPPTGEEPPANKKAAKTRACDLCRKRKHRCDNSDRTEETCSTCRKAKTRCTFDAASAPRAPPKAYVAKLEALVAQHQPDFDLTAERAGSSSSNTLPRPSSLAEPQSLPPPQTRPSPYIQHPHNPQLGHDQSRFPSHPSHAPTFDQSTRFDTSLNQLAAASDLHLESKNLSRLPHNSSFPPSQERYAPPEPFQSNHLSPHQPYDPRPQTSSTPVSDRSPYEAHHPPPQAHHIYQHQHPPYGQPNAPSAYPTHSPSSTDSPRFGRPAMDALSRTSTSSTREAGPDVSLSHHHDDSRLQSLVRVDRDKETGHAAYIGRSSGLPLYIQAIDFKWEGWTDRDKSNMLSRLNDPDRQIYWRTPQWEKTTHVFDAAEVWPVPEMAASLIERYFCNENEWRPLLDRLQFDRMYRERRFDSSVGFKRVCLLVFALGARGLGQDRRFWMPKAGVALGGESDDLATWGRLSAGWHFFHAHRCLLPIRPAYTEIFDLQVASLSVSFSFSLSMSRLTLLSSSSHRSDRYFLPLPGVLAEGLHFAYDVGAHRQGFLRVGNVVAQEDFRRAFWVLYVQEKELSGGMGRPSMIHDEDFDVTLPLECDDEFKETGSSSSPVYFRQPEDTPSKITAFVHLIKLHEISSIALSFFYAAKPPPHTISPTDMVEVLSNRLEDWKASLPMHLRYDSTRPNDIFFRQAASLQVTYNMVVSYVHRPFLPTPNRLDQFSPVSLRACHDAAASTARVFDKVYSKTQETLPHFFFPVTTACYVLLQFAWNPQTPEHERSESFALASRCLVYHAEREKTDWLAGKGKDAIEALLQPRPATSRYVGPPNLAPLFPTVQQEQQQSWPGSQPQPPPSAYQPPHPYQYQHFNPEPHPHTQIGKDTPFAFDRPASGPPVDVSAGAQADLFASLFGGDPIGDFWWERVEGHN